MYDVTSYIDHPGEDLEDYKGCDATLWFEGDNEGEHIHSKTAKKLLKNYKIGVLKSDK